MKVAKLALIFFLSMSWTFVQGQSAAHRKAGKFYKEERYAQAIPHFETAIEQAPNLSLKTKLANCYRLTNQMEKALELYEVIVQDEKTRPIQYYYYGEVLMNKGKYNEARNWFLKYSILEPTDESAIKKAQACAYIESIEPLFKEVELSYFSMNSDEDDNAPVFMENGIVFTSDRNSGVKLLKQRSGWTGRNFLNLYYSEQTADGSFGTADLLGKKLFVLNKNTSSASFTADGKEIFFARNRMEANRNREYTLQLYAAQSDEGGRWGSAEVASFCSENHNYMHPSISADGKIMFFASDKPNGEGGLDLYVSRKIGKTWKRPQNLGPNVNTPEHEGFPFLYSDGKLFFCSKGHIGYGGFDIFFTELDTAGIWQKPINVGQPINSPADDISFYLSIDGSKGAFSSGRDGSDDDIFIFKTNNKPNYQLANVLDFGNELPALYEESKPDEINHEGTTKKNEKKELVGESTKPEIEEKSNQQVIAITKASKETEFKAAAEKDKDQDPTKNRPKNEQQKLAGSEEKLEKELEVFIKSDVVNYKAIEPVIPDLEKENKENKWLVEEALVKQRKEVLNSSENNKPRQIFPDESFLVKAAKENSFVQNVNVSFKPPELQPRKLDKTALNSWPLNHETPFLDGSNIGRTRKKVLNSSKAFSDDFFEEVRSKYTGAANDVGKIFRILDSYFLEDNTEIQKGVAEKLDKLVEMLNYFPSLDIEIRGHTESVGDHKENIQLSQSRADSALEYLISKGISKNRLNAIGYGERFLLNNCIDGVNCSQQEHKQNQRLEFRVLKM